MPHPRRRLTFEDWPAIDRELWERATRSADLLDEPGLAAHWKAKTRHSVSTRYALWLGWLRDQGLLDPNQAPAARVTRVRLAQYVQHLRSNRSSPTTVAGRIRDLREAIRVMQPKADLLDLTNLLSRLDAVAEPTRQKRTRIVSPAALVDAAIVELKKQHTAFDRLPSRPTAGRFRDALIVAFLAMRPVRLENLGAMTIDRHLIKRGDQYWCFFGKNETKDSRLLEFCIPQTLTSWFDLYLTEHRPLLLRGTKSSRVWISIRATPMVDNSIYYRVTASTNRLIGRRINPHLFRDCATTFIAEQDPEHIRIVANILGHATLKTSEQHYNHASTLSVHERYLNALSELRSGAPELC